MSNRRSSSVSFRSSTTSRRLDRAASAVLEQLESRHLLAGGGGFTSSGLLGEYFANNSLTGPAAFTRRDVRVDFDWGTAKPGGSPAVPYSSVPADNFSVRWTGQFIPEFSQAYTFYTSADNGVRLYYKPTTTQTWTTLINYWSGETGAERSGTTATLTAGTKYDIMMEYNETTGSAMAKLSWSSASTPKQIIDPVRTLSLGLSGQKDSNPDEPFVDIWKANRNDYKLVGTTIDAPVDSAGWPTSDFQTILWDGSFLTGDQHGVYKLSFTGQAATVALKGAAGSVSAPSYDAVNNISSYDVTISTTTSCSPTLAFSGTKRTNSLNTGLTNIHMLRPGYSAQETFTTPLKNLISKYSVMRFMDWLDTNSNPTANWGDRTKPADNQRRTFGGELPAGTAWEYVVQLANETGKDIWINIPAMATGDVDINGVPTNTSTSYVYKLAQLIKFGSDGTNPYTTTQVSPAYPPLNPNLRVYIEFSNEVWNTLGSFQQNKQNQSAAEAEVAAGTFLNYDGSSDHLQWARRRVGERIKDISAIFRNVFGDAQMPGTSANPRIRPVLEWHSENIQNTARDPLEYLNDIYNNADGITHVTTPHTPSYYLYGGGGTAYFGSGNSMGNSTIVFANSLFETPNVSGYQQAPTGASWTFSGTAGIADNNSSLGNVVDHDGTPSGTQVGYIRGTASMTQTINFTSTGTFGVYFTASQVPNAGSPQGIKVFLDGVQIGGTITPQGAAADKPTASPPEYHTHWKGYPSVEFNITAAGNHTIKLQGTSANANDTVFIEDVKIQSEDTIFSAGIPTTTWRDALDTAADWATAYGLKYVAYEGGWSLVDNGGASFSLTGVQATAREDSRATAATLSSYNTFAQTGGVLYNDFGSSAKRLHPWLRTDNIDKLNTPLIQAVDQGNSQLAPNPDNCTTIPATLSASTPALTFNNSGLTLNKGGWVDWSIWVPTAGQYNFGVDAGDGGTLQILVDGVQVDSFASGNALTRARTNVTLSRGLHSLRIRNASTTTSSFSVNSVAVLSGTGAATGPALATMELAGQAGNETYATFDSIAGTVTIGTNGISRGSGLQPGNPVLGSGGYISSPVGSTWAADMTAAITMNQYITFTVSPASGQSLSLSKLSFATYNQNNRPAFGAGVRYSTNGGGTFTTATTTASGVNYEATLSGITALQNTTATVIFRIYFWGNSSSEANGIGKVSGNDLVVWGSTATTSSVPAAPSGLSASPVSSTQINLAWTDNSGNETGFKVDRATNSTFTTGLTTATLGANVTSYNSTGLTAGTTYYYRVYAYNGSGNSAYTTVVSATTPNAAPPAPTNFTAVRSTAAPTTQIDLAWTDNSTNETGFKIQRATDSGFTANLVTINVGANIDGYFDTALTPWTTYYYRICSTNGSGDSAWTATVSAQTLGVPAAPTSLSATAVSPTQVDLAFTDNSGTETGYRIERSLTSDFATITSFTMAAGAGTGTRNYSDTSALPNTLYYYRACAFNAQGDSTFTNTASVTTPASLPAAPTNLDAVRSSTSPITQIDLVWTDNAGNESGFKIQRATDAAFTANLTTINVGANVTSYSDTGLAAWTWFYYRVCATNSSGDSAWSTSDSAQTLGVPAIPSNMTATAVSSTQVDLSFSDNSGTETGYRIERSLTPDFATVVSFDLPAYTGTGTRTYSDTTGLPATAYYYRVCAYNAQGDSDFSDTAVAITLAGNNGLRGEYYDNMDLTSLKLTRTDSTVNFLWSTGSPDPLVGADTFSVRWTGQVQAQYTETYTFYTGTDDGVRLWVNGVQLINDWTNHSETERSGTIALVAGERYNIKMEYYDNTGGATAKLSWSSPSTPKAIIPNSQLFSTVDLSLAATAGAYVRDGSYASDNYGTASTLEVKNGLTGYTRWSYLTFDLTMLGNVGSAKLRLNGYLSTADTVSISVYEVTDPTWSEDTLTWNNQPTSGTTALATTVLSSTTAQWYEWDLTTWLQAQLAAGKTSVSIVLKSDAMTSNWANAIFNSDEAFSDVPELSGLLVTA